MKRIKHCLLCPGQVQTQLGMLVNFAAQGDRTLLQRSRLFKQFCRHISLCFAGIG
jgi:hypothetical protein